MSGRSITRLWVPVWVFWLFLSRNNHPTFVLNGIATTILVGSSAVAVFVWHHQFCRHAFWTRIAFRSGCTFLLGTFAAVAIHLVYDQLLGPDPRRFRFLTNVVMDTAFVAVHTVLAFGILVFRRSGVARR